MKSSVSHGRTVKSAFLVILMIIMTQVGYLDLINSPKTGNDSFDDDSPVMETGGSGSAIVYSNNKMSVGSSHTCAILDDGGIRPVGRKSRNGSNSAEQDRKDGRLNSVSNGHDHFLFDTRLTELRRTDSASVFDERADLGRLGKDDEESIPPHALGDDHRLPRHRPLIT